MWYYEAKFQHPVKVNHTDPRLAKLLLAQYGGPQGECAAALRYLDQRYAMSDFDKRTAGLLTDIGTEEMAHLEILGELYHQLVEGVPLHELQEAGLAGNYVEFGTNPFYINESGQLWTAGYISATGDPLADVHEDIAAEEKARAVYEHLIDLTDDPDVKDALQFLWSREIVHSRRFREAAQHLDEVLHERRSIVIGGPVSRTNRYVHYEHKPESDRP